MKEGKTVWLCCDVAETRTPESLAQFSDALCVPIRSATGRSHGTLHVYRLNAYFTERDVKFCEALTGYLANSLQLLRARQALEAENSRLKTRLSTGEVMVGDSAAMRELRQTIERVAPKPTTVLICGETGVGKELVALALHRMSNRAHGPMVTVNCASVPGSLMEAELFGYRKGAFSGADRDHPGFFLQADEGTIFLDEVGELSPECQARLLRVLDGRSFRQIGATNEAHVNVRVVAATNRNLAEEVKKGRFREDLFYRLQGMTITVPPLRDHVDDIPMMAQYFLDKLSTEHRRQYRLTEPALTRLIAYAWPGNVRQLRSALEYAAIMAKSDEIDENDFQLDAAAEQRHLPLNLSQLERWAVEEALKRANGNKSKAASFLGINRETLYAKIEKYGLDRVAEQAAS
jgi:Nif-specific regulatory protein